MTQGFGKPLSEVRGVNLTSLPFAESLAKEATGGQVLTARADGAVEWASSSGVTVATSVSGLPSSPASGATAMLRMGSSPYEYLLLTYDSTYAKWVSAEQRQFLWYTTSDVSQTDVLTVTEVGNNICPFVLYKTYVDAGLSLQIRLRVKLIASAKYVRAQLGMYTFNAGDSSFGSVVWQSATEVEQGGGATGMKDSGWQVVSGLTSRDMFIFILGGYRESGGSPISVSYGRPTAAWRWVS
jgi:hypothetical protein